MNHKKYPTHILTLIALLLSTFLHAEQPLQPTFENLFHQANNFFCNGQFEQAVSSYEKAVQKNPHHAEPFFNMALALKELQRIPQAIHAFKQALYANKNYDRAEYLLAQLLWQTGKKQEAIQHYKRAIALAPHNHAALTDLGNAYKELEQFDDALRCYEKAHELNPSSTTLNAQAQVYGALGETQKALTLFEEILRLRPDDVTTLYNCGYIHKMAGNPLRAIEYYQKTLTLDPAYEPAHFAHAMAHLNAGDFANGFTFYERHLRAQGRNADLLRLYLKNGDIAGKTIMVVISANFKKLSTKKTEM